MLGSYNGSSTRDTGSNEEREAKQGGGKEARHEGASPGSRGARQGQGGKARQGERQRAKKGTRQEGAAKAGRHERSEGHGRRSGRAGVDIDPWKTANMSVSS